MPTGKPRQNRMRGFSLLPVAAVMLAAAAALAGGIALADTTNGGGVVPSNAEYAAGQRAQLAKSIASEQATALGILSRAQTPTDAIPQSGVTPLVDGSFIDRYGANVALARRADGLTAGAAWVVPGTGAVCLLSASSLNSEGSPIPGMPGGGVCTTTASVTAGTTYVVSGSRNDPGVEFLAGIVPDGVGSVTVSLADGTTLGIAVHENVYTAAIHGSISEVRFTGPNGPVVLDHVGA